MSFSSDVRKEVISYTDLKRHCKIAELAAMICFCGDYDGEKLCFRNENKDVVNKYNDLLIRLFDVKVQIKNNEALICGKNAFDVLNVTGLLSNNKFKRRINSLVINEICCKRAFIRGAFICCGSLSDPEKNYHLEFLCRRKDIAEELSNTVNSFEVGSKVIKRKNYYVVYIKDAQQIVEVLNVIAANKAFLKLENMRVVKDVRNSVNRKVNCETANLNKTVSAAVMQKEAIEYIRKNAGLDILPDNLKAAAVLRIKYPDLSLKEIGELLTPPIGKSGVNHRFKKIIEIAENLKGGL